MTTSNMELAAQIAAEKKTETAARTRRVALEDELLGRIDNQLKEAGTVTLADCGVKVTTGLTRKWNDAALSALVSQVRPEYWPFKQTWNEKRAESKALETQHPELWVQVSAALTETPKRPTIAVLDTVAVA